MNVNGIGAVGYPVREHTTGKAKKNVTSGSAGFIETVVEKGESVVDQYKRKHPEDVSHVDAQVRATPAQTDGIIFRKPHSFKVRHKEQN